MEYTFETLLAEIKQDKSIKSLVIELKIMAQDFTMEEPDEVLFTRMKKDFHYGSLKRQHALMLLSLWLGLNKPHLGLSYQALLGFPRSSDELAGEDTRGVLIAFAFMGENIDATTVDFLKQELPLCIKDLKLTYLNEKRVNYLATSSLARLPVREGAAGYPSTFGQAMRDALSLAYQMIVTWQLSPLHNNRINLIIAIDAGEFQAVEIGIKDLMAPDLPAEHPIRLSHFACTAARQAYLKVVFRAVRYPSVWSAEHFWAFPYFRNPPILMPGVAGSGSEKAMLPVTDDEVKDFRKALFLGDPNGPGILSVVNQYPPKIVSSLEIAHVVTLRRLHHEAVHLLTNVLSFDPLNHVARTLRMHNFMALGIYARDWDTAKVLFERGIHEGLFIESRCTADPEFYAEYSIVYWARAVKLIRLLRKGLIKEEDVDERKTEVLESLKHGEECARKGLAASTSGSDSRCVYWLLYCSAFRQMLEKDQGLLTDVRRPFEDVHGLFPVLYDTFSKGFGLVLPEDSSGFIDEALSENRAVLSAETFLNSLSSSSQYPHAAFGVCTFLWDFAGPGKKRKVVDHVLLLLEIIRMKIDELKPLCLGTYSATPALIEIQSPREYIFCIEKAKKAVEEIKKSENYATGMKLLLVNIDFETGSSPITFDLMRKEETS